MQKLLYSLTPYMQNCNMHTCKEISKNGDLQQQVHEKSLFSFRSSETQNEVLVIRVIIIDLTSTTANQNKGKDLRQTMKCIGFILAAYC